MVLPFQHEAATLESTSSIAMTSNSKSNNDLLKSSGIRSQPTLASCSPHELASWLLNNRFVSDEMALTTFLLEAVSSLPNAQDISDQLCKPDHESSSDLGSRLPCDESLTLSLINPRGKFVAEWHERGLHLIDSKQNGMNIKPETIQHLVIFPKPEDMRAKYSKTQSEFALMVFRTSATCQYKDKPQRQLCIQLPSTSDSFVKNLCDRLSIAPGDVVRVSDSLFRSHQETDTSTTTGGLPFVPCYHGVHDGVLFPLSSGLLFYKPPLFVARQDIHSIACGGRSGGDMSGRYVDLIVQTTDETSMEFSNIHRAEGSGLNSYIQLLVNEGECGKSGMGAATSDTEADVCESAVLEPPIKSGRPPRKAALAARAACRDQDNAAAADEEELDDDYIATLDPPGEQESENSEDEQSVSSSSAESSRNENHDTETEEDDSAVGYEDNGPPTKKSRRG